MKNISRTVLALKYRPRNFNELIGQDVMVQTITNSIKLNKLPNAYLLTGIRGVGKTTTARIIAKSLNCKNGIVNLCSGNMCETCEGITNSNHLDVLEMDAASRTGIDDVRQLIESSEYIPTSAKYKIFIIDEVHMLSKQAFNGLLKTLEEPPKHLKFIFATTEVKKIPLTIISRCQRFDLQRVSIKNLLMNLEKIVKNENGKITNNALKLIARAAEGSVRDSLSLLDRALVSQSIEEKEIDEIFVRKMLGIADRSKILELFRLIFNGETKSAMSHLRKLIDEGVQPVLLLNDFLEIIYFMIRKKNFGDFESDISASEAELESIYTISKDVNMNTLTIFWQFVLKGIEEMSIVSNQILSLEMLVFRLIHIKEMPNYKDILKSIEEKNIVQNERIETGKATPTSYLNLEKSTGKKSTDQMKNIIQTKSEEILEKSYSISNDPKLNSLKTFEELINFVSIKREVELKYDLEKNVNLVKFSEGKIDISFNEKLGKNFIRNLAEKLFEWTGKRWVISLTREKGNKTYAETDLIKKKALLDKEKEESIYKQFINDFPDAELIKVTKEE